VGSRGDRWGEKRGGKNKRLVINKSLGGGGSWVHLKLLTVGQKGPISPGMEREGGTGAVHLHCAGPGEKGHYSTMDKDERGLEKGGKVEYKGGDAGKKDTLSQKALGAEVAGQIN